MRIFHIATRSDWHAAQASGRYTTSTLGRTLAEEGFVHCSRADQWQGVRERFYTDVGEPLVLLVIDSDRLSAPVVEEVAPDADETFPHVYGAIETSAVVQVLALADAAGSSTERRSFFSLWLEEVRLRMALGLVVIVVSVGLCALALTVFGDVAALVTILVALTVGFMLVAVVLRRRERRLRRP